MFNSQLVTSLKQVLRDPVWRERRARLAPRMTSPLGNAPSASRRTGALLGYALVLLVFSGLVASAHGTRVVVLGDDWPLSDYAFDASRQESQDLAAWIAGFFAGESVASFLVVSDSPPVIPFGHRGVNGSELALFMQSLGHSWNAEPDAEFTFSNLSQYQAVFLSGSRGTAAAETAALTQYVQAGGGVFVAGGTGDLGNAAEEAEAWAPLLSEFGLKLGAAWFGGDAGSLSEVPTAAVPPASLGVSSVIWSMGQLATVLDSMDPLTDVALRGDFSAVGSGPQGSINDLLAIYEKPFLAGDYNDDGQVDSADYTVWRDSLGEPISLPGDATPGVVDASDYLVWRDNYGASELPLAATRVVEAPESSTLMILLSLALTWVAVSRRRTFGLRRGCC